MTAEGGVLSHQDILATPLAHWLVQAIIVILLTRTLAIGLYYVGQPRVIAEVIGGIILGPSVFGRHIPGFSERVFPESSLEGLGLVANIGLVLYLFLVGIEMDPDTMVKNARKTILVALSGVGLPFALGFAMSPYLFAQVMETTPGYEHVSKRSFSMFVCVAISITAFPVLARILNETNMLRTVVGSTAMGAAALDDVTAWSLLALSIAMIHASNPATAAYIFLSVAAYALGVLVFLRPIWTRAVELVEHSGSHALRLTLMAATFLLVFFSAWVTEILGVHAIFGAFLFGLAMPRGHRFTLEVSEKIEDIVQIVFLPLYFTLSGLKTDISEIHDARDGLVLLVVLLTAIAAKFVGCFFGAKLTGLTYRESAVVGVLMNTRGLVELIVLNVGLEAKVISPKLFTIMVLMALTTTVMTTPLVALLYPHKHRTYVDDHDNDAATATTRVKRGPNDVAMLMVVHNLEEIPAMANIIHLLKPDKDGKQRIHAAALIEASSSTTDIVRATQADAFVPDSPALQMLQAVGIIVGAHVETQEIVGNPRKFAEQLTRQATERLIETSIVPYFRPTLHFMHDSYDKFLHDYINSAQNTVVLLVLGSRVTHSILAPGKHEILALITGDKSDFELLHLLQLFARQGEVHISLLLLLPDEDSAYTTSTTTTTTTTATAPSSPTAAAPPLPPSSVDPDLLRAIDALYTSVTNGALRVSVTRLCGDDCTFDAVKAFAQGGGVDVESSPSKSSSVGGKAYDFVMVSHSKADIFHAFPDKTTIPDRPPQHAGGHRSRLNMSGDFGRRGNGNSAAGLSGDYGVVASDANASTPKAHQPPAHAGGKKIAGKNVLGLLGAQLSHASIGPSLLVVHGVDSHVQLTTVRNRSLGKAEGHHVGLEMKRLTQKMAEYHDKGSTVSEGGGGASGDTRV